MKLYHVSDIAGIEVFEPRQATLDEAQGEHLVWAVGERLLHNFLVPRDCPRVTFYVGPNTTEADATALMGDTLATHVVTIETGWLERMRQETLYLYEMPPDTFELFLDDNGPEHYVSREAVVPTSVTLVDDLLAALTERDVEFRVTPSLWPLRDRVTASTIQFSCYRMRNAKPRP